MRLWLLYLRSRLAFPALTGLLLIAVVCWAIGNRWGDRPDLFLIATVTMPLAATVIICATTGSPFGEMEHSVSRPLNGFRLSQLLGLLLVAAIVLATAATAWSAVGAEWRFTRNLLGLAGIGLLFVPLVGGRLSWAPPLGFAILAIFQPGSPDWAWVIQPSSHNQATVLALCLLVTGLTVAMCFGARDAHQTDVL